MSKRIFNKDKIFSDYKMHANDTGSPFVQVALLSNRIKMLTDHLSSNKKDFDARRSLLILVARRRSFLRYIKKAFALQYQDFIQKLQLKDKK